MVNRAYDYQYETSPRKIRPDYNDKPKKQVKKKKSTALKKKPSLKPADKKKNLKRNKKMEEFVFGIKVSTLLLVSFSMLFIIIYRNSKINESFAKIQKLKSQVTELQKENDQLEISIQNSINTNNIEKAAKEMLGMQKLSSKQIISITLPKRDYVEPTVEEVILEENSGFINNIINKIKGLF